MCLLKSPSRDRLRLESEGVPAWMFSERFLFWSIHMLDLHPVWSFSCPPSLSPMLLIGCLATRIKYRPALSKLSILSIQSLFIFSSTFSPPHLSYSFPLSIPYGGDFGDFGWRNGKHSSNSTSCCCQRRFPQWVTWWPSEGVCWEAVCALGARSGLCSFIRHGAPTCSRGSPPLWGSTAVGLLGSLQASSQSLVMF